MNSPGCPLPVKQVGGRLAVTVFDMATWLAGEPISSIEVPPTKDAKVAPSETAKPVVVQSLLAIGPLAKASANT